MCSKHGQATCRLSEVQPRAPPASLGAKAEVPGTGPGLSGEYAELDEETASKSEGEFLRFRSSPPLLNQCLWLLD